MNHIFKYELSPPFYYSFMINHEFSTIIRIMGT